MLAEFEMIPIGTKSVSLSQLLADVAKLIDASGLEYRVGPMGTVVEGEWEDVMRLAKSCHDTLRQATGRVVTTIRIDDRSDVPGARLTAKVQSLERAVGRPLKR